MMVLDSFLQGKAMSTNTSVLDSNALYKKGNLPQKKTMNVDFITGLIQQNGNISL